jgi:5-methylcytosine-specific restriction enzyme subunit McrC
VNGFLLNMPQLFEDFVTVALREAIEPVYGGVVVGQWRGHLDERDIVDLRPDIVWSKAGTPVAVADAKYKAEKPSGYPNADLYQLLAYCTVLGLRIGHLIYAAGNEEAVHHVVRGADVEIICHALDLGHPPDRLLTEVRDLARKMIIID